jgi:hypothetical protein
VHYRSRAILSERLSRVADRRFQQHLPLGVWARIHEKDFDTIHDFWEKAGREHMIGPFKGRLANSLSIYPETLNLRLEVKIRPAGERPVFLLEEAEHPLTIEQRIGLNSSKAREYACLLLRKSRSEV